MSDSEQWDTTCGRCGRCGLELDVPLSDMESTIDKYGHMHPDCYYDQMREAMNCPPGPSRELVLLVKILDKLEAMEAEAKLPPNIYREEEYW